MDETFEALLNQWDAYADGEGDAVKLFGAVVAVADAFEEDPALATRTAEYSCAGYPPELAALVFKELSSRRY